MTSKKVNVMFNGWVVGETDVRIDSGIFDLEIEHRDLKYILSDYDPAMSFATITRLLIDLPNEDLTKAFYSRRTAVIVEEKE